MPRFNVLRMSWRTSLDVGCVSQSRRCRERIISTRRVATCWPNASNHGCEALSDRIRVDLTLCDVDRVPIDGGHELLTENTPTMRRLLILLAILAIPPVIRSDEAKKPSKEPAEAAKPTSHTVR